MQDQGLTHVCRAAMMPGGARDPWGLQEGTQVSRTVCNSNAVITGTLASHSALSAWGSVQITCHGHRPAAARVAGPASAPSGGTHMRTRPVPTGVVPDAGHVAIRTG